VPEIFPDKAAMNAAMERAEQEISALRTENAALYERDEASRLQRKLIAKVLRQAADTLDRD
jgi:hypothetical protein